MLQTARVMGRLHRKAPRYRVWAPAESSVRIEYSMEVLREAARHERGVLYGTRDGATIRVVAARIDQAGRDARLAKLELLGIFAFRARGEIFLTELDLEHLERTGGSLALVVAGTHAGFFVYEPDGAIQTIKSYQEFSLFDRLPEPRPAPEPRPDRRRLWIAAGCLAALVVSVIPHEFPRARPLALSVHEEGQQLRISWARNAFPSALLEISDGAERRSISVPPSLFSATYVPLTGDVSIRLIAGARSETAHFVDSASSPPVTPKDDSLKQLESEAEALRNDLAEGRQRAATLQTAVDAIIGSSPR